MPTFLFWNRNRSGIHINIIRMLYAFWYMGMPIQQNVSFLKRWQIALIKMMTMCGINYIFFICNHTIICQNRELQYHLIYFRITISPHTENVLFTLI